MSQRNRILLIIGLIVSIAGCADYLNNRDTVTTGAGDALEANKGIHTTKPFPREAWRTTIPGDGPRTYETMRKYHGRPAKPPASTAPAAPPAYKPATGE